MEIRSTHLFAISHHIIGTLSHDCFNLESSMEVSRHNLQDQA
jgi:hypothetical protein